MKRAIWIAALAAHAAVTGSGPQIYSLAWRPDGAMIALGGYKEVRLVDAATRKTVATLAGHAEAVRAVAWSRDGKWLAAGGGLPARRGEVKVWDVDRRVVMATLNGHSDCVYGLAFAEGRDAGQKPGGRAEALTPLRLASASYDRTIKIWDGATETRTLRDHVDAVYAIAFTPDGKRLVTGSADRSVKVWDVETGTRLYTLSGATDAVQTVAISPDGSRVAAGGVDKTIRIWRLGEKDGVLENSLIAHEDAILKLAWSADGQYLASASADHTIKILRATDLSEVRSIPKLPDWAFGLEFAPKGKSLAAGFFNGDLEIYD